MESISWLARTRIVFNRSIFIMAAQLRIHWVISVFDGAPTVESWNRGALLEVGLNEDAQTSSACL